MSALPGAAGTQSRPWGATEPTEQERTAATALLHMIWGSHISRAVYLAAELGVADLLAEGPRTAAILPGGHFDAYVRGFEASSSVERDFLVEHLGG